MRKNQRLLSAALVSLPTLCQAADQVVFVNHSSASCRLNFSHLYDQSDGKQRLRIVLERPGASTAETLDFAGSGEVEVPGLGGRAHISNGPGSVEYLNTACFSVVDAQGRHTAFNFDYLFRAPALVAHAHRAPGGHWHPWDSPNSAPVSPCILRKQVLNDLEILELTDPPGKAAPAVAGLPSKATDAAPAGGSAGAAAASAPSTGNGQVQDEPLPSKGADHALFINNSSRPCRLAFSHLYDQADGKQRLRIVVAKAGGHQAVTHDYAGPNQVEVPGLGGQAAISNGPGVVDYFNTAAFGIVDGLGRKTATNFDYIFRQPGFKPRKAGPGAHWFQCDGKNEAPSSCPVVQKVVNGVPALELQDAPDLATGVVHAPAGVPDHVVFINRSSDSCDLCFSNLFNQADGKQRLRVVVTTPGNPQAVTTDFASDGKVQVPGKGGRALIGNGPGSVKWWNEARFQFVHRNGWEAAHTFEYLFRTPAMKTHRIELGAHWRPSQVFPNQSRAVCPVVQRVVDGVEVLEFMDPVEKANAQADGP